MSESNNSFADARFREYASEFIRGYSRAIDANYPDVKTFIFEAGLERDYLPLYGRELGVNISVSGLYTKSDFYLFFLRDESSDEISIIADADVSSPGEFSREWTYNTPDELRIAKVKEYLGIEAAKVIQLTPSWDAINIPGANMMAPSMSMAQNGNRHRVAYGNQAGARAGGDLPEIREMLHNTSTLADLAVRYMMLTNTNMSPQARGQEFEKLWREVLDFYGWKPKKVRIPGEDNDFTAIYQGLHILGEVRWFDKPMNGGKMREFLAKLDPRPQTIGLFVSISGVDPGGISVVRRAVNSKTVVIFDKDDIEKVIVQVTNPGPIFSEKLRDAYDYIFESTETS